MASTAAERSSTEALLSGILAILVAQREDAGVPDGSRKTEVLLSDAGLSIAQIAEAIGKNEPAVRKTIQRAR
jgi:DNA-directed RNA polymerase specialized sigma24 family protein